MQKLLNKRPCQPSAAKQLYQEIFTKKIRAEAKRDQTYEQVLEMAFREKRLEVRKKLKTGLQFKQYYVEVIKPFSDNFMLLTARQYLMDRATHELVEKWGNLVKLHLSCMRLCFAKSISSESTFDGVDQLWESLFIPSQQYYLALAQWYYPYRLSWYIPYVGKESPAYFKQKGIQKFMALPFVGERRLLSKFVREASFEGKMKVLQKLLQAVEEELNKLALGAIGADFKFATIRVLVLRTHELNHPGNMLMLNHFPYLLINQRRWQPMLVSFLVHYCSAVHQEYFDRKQIKAYFAECKGLTSSD